MEYSTFEEKPEYFIKDGSVTSAKDYNCRLGVIGDLLQWFSEIRVQFELHFSDLTTSSPKGTKWFS